MSVSISTEEAWTGLVGTENPFKGWLLTPSPALNNLETRNGEAEFQGRIEVSGILSLPEQTFRVHFDRGRFSIESQSVDSWPLMRIECEADPVNGEFAVTDFAFRLRSETLDGWLLQTRVIWCLEQARTFSIETAKFGQVLDLRYDLLDATNKKTLQRMASFVRKLKFIADVFNVTFDIPDLISSEELRLAEIIYRGVTEGEFTIRSATYLIEAMSATEIEVNMPPAAQPGFFSLSIGDRLRLFGSELLLGPITLSISKGVLANAELVECLRKEPTRRADVRLEVLDNQITYRFETYARQPSTRRDKRLKRFKDWLSRQEPRELVDLVDDS